MAVLGYVLSFAIWLYLWVLTARALISFIPVFKPGWQPRGALLVVAETVYTLTDPPLRFLRRHIRPLRVGDVTLDLGFLVLFIALSLLQRVVVWAFV